jgi:glucoamylase
MAPGPAPIPVTQAQQSWTSGAKDVVMTAVDGSRVWATMGQGIVTEVYWPAVDQPEVKDFGFLVAGNGWWREVKRVGGWTLTQSDPAIALPTVTHTGSGTGWSYTLTLRPVVHAQHDVLLVAYTLTGDATHLHPLLAPHLQVSQFVADPSQIARLGADNTAWVDPADRAMFATGSGRFLCLLASPGFTAAGAGYVGDTDGWTDLARHTRMTYDYTQAGPGVVAPHRCPRPGIGAARARFRRQRRGGPARGPGRVGRRIRRDRGGLRRRMERLDLGSGAPRARHPLRLE